MATTDLMLTVVRDGVPQAIAIAVKPADIVQGKNAPKQRTKERLVLEMAYTKELGMRWLLLSNHEVPEYLRDNLELAIPASVLPDSISDELITDYCDSITEHLRAGLPVGEACLVNALKFNLDDTQASAIFNHGMWWRQIPIDLRHPIIMSRPARLTDFGWAQQDINRIFGGAHD